MESKRKLVKKNWDMLCVNEGRPVESDDPFQQFLKQLAKDKERKKRQDEQAERKRKEEADREE